MVFLREMLFTFLSIIDPISITGKKPAEGTVTSQAYIRVDFP